MLNDSAGAAFTTTDITDFVILNQFFSSVVGFCPDSRRPRGASRLDVMPALQHSWQVLHDNRQYPPDPLQEARKAARSLPLLGSQRLPLAMYHTSETTKTFHFCSCDILRTPSWREIFSDRKPTASRRIKATRQTER